MAPDPVGLDQALRAVLAERGGSDPTAYDPLEATVAVCLDTVPDAEAGAISYVMAGRVSSTHATDPEIADLDRRHRDLARGPLIDAAATQPMHRSVTIVEDLAEEDVWGAATPPFVSPFRSLHSTTLRSAHGGRAALDLYATTAHAFGFHTTVLADMFAVRLAHLLYGRGQALDDGPSR